MGNPREGRQLALEHKRVAGVRGGTKHTGDLRSTAHGSRLSQGRRSVRLEQQTFSPNRLHQALLCGPQSQGLSLDRRVINCCRRPTEEQQRYLAVERGLLGRPQGRCARRASSAAGVPVQGVGVQQPVHSGCVSPEGSQGSGPVTMVRTLVSHTPRVSGPWPGVGFRNWGFLFFFPFVLFSFYFDAKLPQ